LARSAAINNAISVCYAGTAAAVTVPPIALFDWIGHQKGYGASSDSHKGLNRKIVAAGGRMPGVRGGTSAMRASGFTRA